MIVRKIQEQDLESIIELYKQFWGDISNLDKMKKKCKETIGNSNFIVLCVEIDKKVVGTITGIVCNDLYGDCKPFLVMENLITSKEYRKKGIGKALLSELEKKGREMECTQILFITETNRNDAISFYEAMGYDPKTHVGFKKSLV